MGAGTLTGNPWEMRFCVPLGATQPTVGVGAPLASRELLQLCIKPGILPAMEVIWKVEIVSNNHPYPTLTASLGPATRRRPHGDLSRSDCCSYTSDPTGRMSLAPVSHRWGDWAQGSAWNRMAVG